MLQKKITNLKKKKGQKWKKKKTRKNAKLMIENTVATFEKQKQKKVKKESHGSN